jgi:hypothetical protein
LEPSDFVSITLEARQWNLIIEVLHDVPYRVAAPLIQAIGQQAAASAAPPPPEGPTDAQD